MATYKVTMHDKQADGSYDTLYPKTTAEQVVGDWLKPQIIVTAPVGSTVVASLPDGTTATAAESFGTWTIDLPKLGEWTVTATKGSDTASTTVTVNATKQFKTTLSYNHIYGAIWDGTSTTKWTRTDESANFSDPVPYVAGATSYGSPFDNIYPWSGMVRVTNAQAGEVVAIPKFYYKWTFSGSSIKLQISQEQVDGFYCSPSHMDRGDGVGERDMVYIGRYKCASTYKSTSGVAPQTSITISGARTSIHNLGSTIWQNDYAMRVTIWMLYLVEFADWNSQAKIGYGCSTSGNIMTMGYTDSMPYHTGTTMSSRTSYGGTQYRYIEGLWDSVYDWCDGIQFDGGTIYVAMNPSDFGTNKTNTGFTRATSGGWTSAFGHSTVSGLEWCIYANAVNSSQSTYVSDYCFYNSGGSVLFVGGYYGQNQYYGLFCLYGYYTSSFSNSYVGSRLMVLP